MFSISTLIIFTISGYKNNNRKLKLKNKIFFKIDFFLHFLCFQHFNNTYENMAMHCNMEQDMFPQTNNLKILFNRSIQKVVVTLVNKGYSRAR